MTRARRPPRALSLQNAHYHLEKLEATSLIEVVDTCYSEKGREIDVFVVSRDPTLMFLSTRDDRPSLKCALRSLASLVGLPSVVLAAGEALSHLTGEE